MRDYMFMALMSLALLLAPHAPARADDMPAYFKEIVAAETATPAEVETKNIVALNATMFDLYSSAAEIFKKNILAEHPVVLGLFSGAGGRFILYRPGRAVQRSQLNFHLRSASAPARAAAYRS